MSANNTLVAGTLALPATINNYPTLVETNQSRLVKIQAAAAQLKAKADAGLSPDVDGLLEKFIVNARTAKTEMEAARKPITAEFDKIRKQFTTIENDVDAAIAIAQVYRNKWAEQVAEANRIAAEKAKAEQYKALELSELKATAELSIKSAVQSMIDKYKTSILEACATITSANFDDKFPKLQNLSVELEPKKYDGILCPLSSKFGHDVVAIYFDKLAELKDSQLSHFRTEMQEFKNGAIANCRNIKDMDDDERTASLAAAKEQIAVESAAAAEVAQITAEVNKEADQAEAIMSIIPESVDAPETRSGYEIVNLTKTGFQKIVAFWFATLYPSFDGDIEKKTVGSMKKDLEKHAHTTGIKIDGIEYKTIYKAVNRK
jgi:hypothetical protein